MASLLSDDEAGNRQVQPERPQVSDPRAARAGAGNGEKILGAGQNEPVPSTTSRCVSVRCKKNSTDLS